MINDLYISKSFCCIGKNLNKCYDCKFCRIVDKQSQEFEYNVIPSKINKNFINIPVVINIFYGDPLIQPKKTLEYLLELEKAKHKGPVIIITKGDLSKFKLPDDLKLDLHLAFSTFGIKHEYDNVSAERLEKNLNTFEKRNYFVNYHNSIEFRPICYGINDTKKIIGNVFDLAYYYGNIPIGYSGLQGVPEIVKYWQKNKIYLIPYPGFNFGHKKSISNEVQDIFDELSFYYHIPIFRKTSCLISYVHNLKRDYNAHYYRPDEMNCKDCAMEAKCFEFKNNLSLDTNLIKDLIPFPFTIEEKTNHECILKKKGICEFPTDDCSKISGKIIKINYKITTADVRMIKWLTGYTVDADFYESNFLNDNWRMHDNDNTRT
jgi:hypothetical protein